MGNIEEAFEAIGHHEEPVEPKFFGHVIDDGVLDVQVYVKTHRGHGGVTLIGIDRDGAEFAIDLEEGEAVRLAALVSRAATGLAEYLIEAHAGTHCRHDGEEKA